MEEVGRLGKENEAGKAWTVWGKGKKRWKEDGRLELQYGASE